MAPLARRSASRQDGRLALRGGVAYSFAMAALDLARAAARLQTIVGARRLMSLLHVYHRLTRPMTLGVRAIVVDGRDRIFMVRHSYTPGWHLPGGGVEPGEALVDALARELLEEGNLVLGAAPALFGVYWNKRASPRDHVAVYLVRDFHQTAPRGPDAEIVETQWFARNALPQDATPGARARLREALDGAPPSPLW